MHFLNYFYNKNLKLDLINKFQYSNLKTFPKLKKIILNFGCKTTDIKKLTASLLALELITNQKGVLSIAKRPNLFLKIRKGNPTGCKVLLRKSSMLNFINQNSIEIFPKIKNFNGLKFSKKIKKNSFSYYIKNTLIFSNFMDHYYLFNILVKLEVTVVTDVKTKKELLFILKSLQLVL